MVQVKTNKHKYLDYLCHHGVEGQKWGVKHGPPYPLDDSVSTGNKLKKRSTREIKKSVKEKQNTGQELDGQEQMYADKKRIDKDARRYGLIGGPLAAGIVTAANVHDIRKEATEAGRVYDMNTKKQKGKYYGKLIATHINGQPADKFASAIFDKFKREIGDKELERNFAYSGASVWSKKNNSLSFWFHDDDSNKVINSKVTHSGKAVKSRDVEIEYEYGKVKKVTLSEELFDAIDGDTYGDPIITEWVPN